MQQVTNYFALKVGIAVTALSTTAFSFCGLVFADTLSPFIEMLDRCNQRQLKEKAKLWMTIAGAGLGLSIGTGFSCSCYLWYCLFERLGSSVQDFLLPKAEFIPIAQS